MERLSLYQLFLLDFDGLLVNTETLHYQAYLTMCAQRGHHLELSFPEYCKIAHFRAEGLEELIYTQLPLLRKEEPRWTTLYQEKKQAYLRFIQKGQVELMPGTEAFLTCLKERQIKHCVVTHSASDLVETIAASHPVLQAIPHWFTRESYTRPKPNSECYEKAIAGLGREGDRIMGLEDTPRGLQALRGTSAQPLLIASKHIPEVEGVERFESLEMLLSKF